MLSVQLLNIFIFSFIFIGFLFFSSFSTCCSFIILSFVDLSLVVYTTRQLLKNCTTVFDIFCLQYTFSFDLILIRSLYIYIVFGV